jgi:hypothetical protein
MGPVSRVRVSSSQTLRTSHDAKKPMGISFTTHYGPSYTTYTIWLFNIAIEIFHSTNDWNSMARNDGLRNRNEGLSNWSWNYITTCLCQMSLSPKNYHIYILLFI